MSPLSIIRARDPLRLDIFIFALKGPNQQNIRLYTNNHLDSNRPITNSTLRHLCHNLRHFQITNIRLVRRHHTSVIVDRVLLTNFPNFPLIRALTFNFWHFLTNFRIFFSYIGITRTLNALKTLANGPVYGSNICFILNGDPLETIVFNLLNNTRNEIKVFR